MRSLEILKSTVPGDSSEVVTYKVTLIKLELLNGPNIFRSSTMCSSIKPKLALSSITRVTTRASILMWMSDPRSVHVIEY